MHEAGLFAVTPLSVDEADAYLAPLGGRKILLAVSGGVDSIALMGLAAKQAASQHRIHVAVVDHGLRSGSVEETQFVCEQAARFGLSSAVLTWGGAKPTTGLQEAARQARYRLLVDHAMELQADALVTAHTLDDQAETIMMRLAAGSGLTGLGGMRARTSTLGLEHVRPFLAVGKERLLATCRAHEWPWIEDPSNRNESFARVRWRQLLPLLAREGLTAERLHQFSRRMAAADAVLQQTAEAALQAAGFQRDGKGWKLDAMNLFGFPAAVSVRALEMALAIDRARSNGADAPRLTRVEALDAALREAIDDTKALRRTLGGYVVSLSRDRWLSAKPEPLRRRGCVNRVGNAGLGKGLPEN